MTHLRIAHGLAITALLAATGPALAQHEGHGQKPHEQGDTHKQDDNGQKDAQGNLPLCPVMGEPVDFSVHTMTEEGPVYFCCPACIKKFEANPAKYADKVAKQREQLEARERIQVVCPISGKPIDKDVHVERDGRTVYFCCAACKPKYEAAPKKYEGKLEASYTYQTRCPVTGEKIDPTAFVDLPTGQRVYFCCPSCEKKLLAAPEKYEKNLEKQGVPIDVKKLKAALEKEGDGKLDTTGGKHGHGMHDHP